MRIESKLMGLTYPYAKGSIRRTDSSSTLPRLYPTWSVDPTQCFSIICPRLNVSRVPTCLRLKSELNVHTHDTIFSIIFHLLCFRHCFVDAKTHWCCFTCLWKLQCYVSFMLLLIPPRLWALAHEKFMFNNVYASEIHFDRS